MEELYHKIVYPSGAIRYRRSGVMESGEPSDGIWYVKRSSSCRSYHLLERRVEDLPRAMKLAALEPLRDEICKAILEIKIDAKMENNGWWITIPCANDICDAIFRRIVDADNQSVCE